MRYIEVKMITTPNIDYNKVIGHKPRLFRKVVQAVVAHIPKSFDVLKKVIPRRKLPITIAALLSSKVGRWEKNRWDRLNLTDVRIRQMIKW